MSVQTSSVVSSTAWEALQGAFDLQVHVAPDVIERRIDDLDLAKSFLSHGMRGFVLKSHYFPTAERAKVVTKAIPGIHAYGALTLNHSVGGLNPVQSRPGSGTRYSHLENVGTKRAWALSRIGGGRGYAPSELRNRFFSVVDSITSPTPQTT